ncbi:MAG TPA: hypothetical protein PLA68_14155, partial [Panacibacter sp.]|nr:hypothetical protein [Panacibacter sp.]
MKYGIYILKIVGISVLLITMLCFVDCNNKAGIKSNASKALSSGLKNNNDSIPEAASANDSIRLDTALYNSKLLSMVHNKPSAKWPVKTPYPLPSAILPFSRVVAYYGNFYSKNMGILGALPAGEMLIQLKNEVSNWQKADSLTPVIPAIHYIAVTA